MKVLGFGAILWDRAAGSIGRGTAAAGGDTIGGSVFNTIAHLGRLGHDAYMLTALGDDPMGASALTEVRRLGIHDDFIGVARAPTCCTEVTYDAQGLPHYEVPDLVSWDQVEITEEKLRAVGQQCFDCFVFGTLEQRNPVSRRAVRAVLERARARTVYLDLTLRGRFYGAELLDYSLRHADIAKMNDEEALEVDRLFGLGESDLCRLLPLIAREFHNQIVCITLGPRGALVGDKAGACRLPGYKVRVSDTVGCGDAFSAGFLHALAAGASIQEAGDLGNRMGALVASKRGAIPDYRVPELDAISEHFEDPASP